MVVCIPCFLICIDICMAHILKAADGGAVVPGQVLIPVYLQSIQNWMEEFISYINMSMFICILKVYSIKAFIQYYTINTLL